MLRKLAVMAALVLASCIEPAPEAEPEHVGTIAQGADVCSEPVPWSQCPEMTDYLQVECIAAGASLTPCAWTRGGCMSDSCGRPSPGSLFLLADFDCGGERIEVWCSPACE